MYKLKTKNNRKYKKLLVISILLVTAISALGLYTFYSTTPKENGISFTPPTQQEKDAGNQQKDVIISQQESSNNSKPEVTTSGKQKVTPIITSANTVSVSSYIPGIFEEGGTCTATFSKGSEIFTKSSEGFGNVSYTQCAPIELQENSFPSKGSWSVSVSYASEKSEGISQSQQIEVK